MVKIALFIKKIVPSALILGVLFFVFGAIKSDAAEQYGKTSFNDGVGKAGSEQEVLTKNDVAVNYTYRYLPKGTPIITINTSSHIKRTLYKWDYGHFILNVILDVQRSMFTEMGGVISNGYFPEVIFK